MPFCPNCGNDITPNAKFCRMCGKKIASGRDISSPPPPRKSIYSHTVQAPRREPELTPPQMAQKPQIEVEPISDGIIAILYSRTRENTIEKDHKNLLEELGDIEKKMEIGILTSEEAMTKMKDIKVRMKQLKEEKAVLKSGRLPAEDYIIDYKKASEKKQKLEEMKISGKISSEKVYEKLKREATAELDMLREKLVNEKFKMEHWSITLEDDVEALKEEIESTKVRSELGEISKEEAKAEVQRMKDELTQKDVAARELKKIVEKIAI
ncbi:MAG: zinc-ribbon domain-containing protein [Candidatus Odinarchaeota archaeon]